METLSDKIVMPKLPEEKVESIIAAYKDHNGKVMPDLVHDVERRVIEQYNQEIDMRLEYALRHLIPNPIKKRITKGKIRYRGLYLRFEMENMHSELKDDVNGGKLYVCHFTPPKLCGRESRSGKRAAFEINLAFPDDIMAQYSFWRDKNKMIVFGGRGRRYGEYLCSGIAEQIKKDFFILREHLTTNKPKEEGL